ncbi:hypothetical protein [Prescottella subtropica]|uniref:hypothetical protein n=1 Tax=Prescottella subtropica TaxID=2545757 RepID=UPI0010F9EB27|nr:hypothetical protein [Prescottella subtropica]
MSSIDTDHVVVSVGTISHTVEYTVAGAGPMTMDYGHQQFTPQQAVVTVERQVGREWAVKAFIARGLRVLKSGKNGQDMRERNVCRGQLIDGRWVPMPADDAPAWVHDLIAQTIQDAQ